MFGRELYTDKAVPRRGEVSAKLTKGGPQVRVICEPLPPSVTAGAVTASPKWDSFCAPKNSRGIHFSDSKKGTVL